MSLFLLVGAVAAVVVRRAPPSARPAVTMSATAAVSTRAGLGCASAEEAAYTLDGGYALEPNADGTGGWLAHRASLDLPSSGAGDDWLPRDMIEAARDFRPAGAKLAHAPRVLVLYGSLRESSFSRRQIPERQTRSRASVWPRRENRALSLLSEPSRSLLSLSLNLPCRRLAHECARLLEAMGADVRVFSPQGLPAPRRRQISRNLPKYPRDLPCRPPGARPVAGGPPKGQGAARAVALVGGEKSRDDPRLPEIATVCCRLPGPPPRRTSGSRPRCTAPSPASSRIRSTGSPSTRAATRRGQTLPTPSSPTPSSPREDRGAPCVAVLTCLTV